LNPSQVANPALIAVILLSVLLSVATAAQKKAHTSDTKSDKPTASASWPVDPAIAAAIRDVSAERVQKTIEKLVSFGTRQTLSVNNPDAASSDKGIVAARDWIKSELERYSADCGGCLEVKTDTFVEQPKNRIPQPTELQNVYAVLRGKDPEQAKSIYLVTGHYDSRNTDILNTTDPAPGANDDGSGTAVSLECAES
jgi:Peptidase family M28